MIPKYVALAFVSIALAGCCAFGTTCEAPMAGPNVAWDGLGPAPDAPAKKKTVSRPRNEVALQPKAELPSDNKLGSRNVWETEAEEDRADDARLAKKLKICDGCSTPEGAGQHLTRRQNESKQMEADVRKGPGTQEPGASAVSPERLRQLSGE
jgi:hypothetical protein